MGFHNQLHALCRTRRGRTENQSLVQRATAAAWQTDHADVTEAAAAVRANTSEQPTRSAQETVSGGVFFFLSLRDSATN